MSGILKSDGISLNTAYIMIWGIYHYTPYLTVFLTLLDRRMEIQLQPAKSRVSLTLFTYIFRKKDWSHPQDTDTESVLKFRAATNLEFIIASPYGSVQT